MYARMHKVTLSRAPAALFNATVHKRCFYQSGVRLSSRFQGRDSAYSATESPAPGLTSTDRLRAPKSAREPLHESGEGEVDREPAAAGTDSGSSVKELREFAENVKDRAQDAFSGKSSSKSQYPVDSSNTPPFRRVSYSSISDQAKEAGREAKSAVKNAGISMMDEASRDIHAMNAQNHAEKGREEAQGVLDSAKTVVKDAYSTAKKALKDAMGRAEEDAASIPERVGNMTKNVSNQMHEAMEETSETVKRPRSEDSRTDVPSGSPPRIDPRSDNM